MKLKEERIEAGTEGQFSERILPRILGKMISEAEWLGDGIALKLNDGTTLFVWGVSGPGGEGAGIKVELEPKKSLYLLSEFSFHLEEAKEVRIRKISSEEKERIIERARREGVPIIRNEEKYDENGTFIVFAPTFKPGDEAIVEDLDAGEVWHLIVEGKKCEK